MPQAASSSTPQRVPYSGIWLDGFSLTSVPGGALLAGGQEWHRDGIGSRARASTGAALWDSSKAEWVELPPMPHPRQDHAAVALPDGRVLLIGGRDDKTPDLGTTLFWDPETRRFHDGPSLLATRSHPAAVMLTDGTVLVLGTDVDDDLERGTRAEWLRPGASAWEPAGQTVRIFHPGPVCVSRERVVIAGRRDNGFGFAIIDGVHHAPPLNQSAELWEPDRRSWRTSHPLGEPRDDASGVTLSDGRILVVGGWHASNLLTSAELWDPDTERWSPTRPLAMARSSFALVALPGARAAVSGGLGDGPFEAVKAVEIWDPVQGAWSPGTPLAVARAGHKLAAQGDGSFLVVGGSRSASDGNPETTSELWRP